jgi:hypothetical protein
MDSKVCIHSRLRLFAVWLGLALLLETGCVSSGHERSNDKQAQPSRKSAAEAQRQISIHELDELTYAYADRYFMIISSAINEIKKDNPDPNQRRIAQRMELNGVLSINNIVSGDDPYSQVFDLVSSVTLQSRLLIDENLAEQTFGDRAQVLIDAIRTMRVEVWNLAAKVLTQDQLERLDYIILEWRRTHPGIEQVSYVKFDDFAGIRASNLVSEVKSGHGFLAPLRSVTKELADTRRLTERIFWYAKRTPNLASAEAAAATDEILSNPEITSTLQTSERIAKLAESIPELVATERKDILADIDARQATISNNLNEVHSIVGDANSLAHSLPTIATNVQQTLTSLQETLRVADDFRRGFDFNQPSALPSRRPFDIDDYTAAFTRLSEAATNLQQLSLSADQLARSEGWNKALRDVSNTADQRVNRIFVKLCLLLVFAFVLAVVYRAIATLLTRTRGTPLEKP